ncbi:hypothetical protein CNR22_11780 [Sphingobacteriaceae bacterium]|nr:hypothetical protein CNR22_11780 [Sphingobacteriaceae bacterium]
MAKHIFLLFILCLAQNFNAQEDPAVAFYNQGVLAFKKNEFVKADSLYTLSVRLSQHPDAYFNRAMARLKLDNKTGYFEDLMAAGILGDKESQEMFRIQTLRSDTLRFCTTIVDYHSDSTVTNFSYIIYTLQNMPQKLELKYNAQNILVNVNWNKEGVPEENLEQENAEFSGGLQAMMTFIMRTTKYPKAEREKKIQGKVMLKFVINTEGCIERISVENGIENCQACDKEAVRVLNAMPRWKPARLKGKAVKTYFRLPFLFKLQ